MHRRPEFSFPGSPARGPNDRLLPPRPPANATAPRPREEEEVRWLQASLQASPDYSSGTPSPQLWSSSHHGHEHRQYPASAGSSPSRAQAIAGYRREMLDLVRGLPESAYELSLRDIVEHHDRPPSSSSSAPLPTPPLPPQPPSSSNAGAATRGHEPAAAVADEQQGAKQSSDKSKKQGRKQRGAMRRQRSRSLERSVSLDTGLLIKFFMPFSIAGRGGKKKVSPKPDAAAKDAKKKKKKKQSDKRKEEPRPQEEEEEWWSKSEFSEAGSSTRTSSTGSSNSNSSAGSSGVRNGGSNPPKAPVRSRSRKRNGCYAFFRANKSKNGVSQD